MIYLTNEVDIFLTLDPLQAETLCKAGWRIITNAERRTIQKRRIKYQLN